MQFAACDIIYTVMGGKKTNKLRQLLGSFKAVRVWQLVLILIPLLFLTATLLRFDHLRMVELRSAVIAADRSGDQAELENAITNLHNFVFSHVVINITEVNGAPVVSFGTGPFYLEQQYRRAADAAIVEAESIIVDDSNPNGNIYAAVSAICQPLAIANGWAWSSPGHIDCWTSELAKYPASDNLENVLTAAVPPTELYRIEYVSPLFSWTPTSFAILACIIITIIIIIRVLIWIVLKIALLILGRA